MMKKSRNRRRRTAKLITKDISKCKYFINIGKKRTPIRWSSNFRETTIQWVLLFSSMMRHISRLLSDGMIIAIMLLGMELKRLSHTI